MVKKKIYPLLIFIILGSGCSKFRKIQKSDDWKVKYEAALKYYEEKDYFRSNVLLEEIIPIIRGTQEAEKANFIYPYTYFHQGQFILSSHYFKTFIEVYGRSEHAEESSYMYAYSMYMQSPVASLDQTSTYEAITALQNFLNKYPASKYSSEADKLIDELQVKLETKAYETAKLYYRLRRYKSAVIAMENFRFDFPDSRFNEELAYLAIETSFDLAQASVPSKQEERFRKTIDQYQKFVDKYPNSKYLKDAEKYFVGSTKQLTTFAN